MASGQWPVVSGQWAVRFVRCSSRSISAADVALALAALPCFAGEVAVLRNGFSIRHERREVVGDITRFYVNADGSSFVDVPTADSRTF